MQTVLSPYNRVQTTASRCRLSCLRTTVSKQQRLDPDCYVSVQPCPNNSVSIQTVMYPYNRVQTTASRSRLLCLRTTVSKQQRLDPDCPVSVQPCPNNSVSIQTVLSPYNRVQTTASRVKIHKSLAKFPNSTTSQFLLQRRDLRSMCFCGHVDELRGCIQGVSEIVGKLQE